MERLGGASRRVRGCDRPPQPAGRAEELWRDRAGVGRQDLGPCRWPSAGRQPLCAGGAVPPGAGRQGVVGRVFGAGGADAQDEDVGNGEGEAGRAGEVV